MDRLLNVICEWPKKHEFWIGILSLSIAVGSFVIASASLEASRQQARTVLYIEFKRRFSEFRHENTPPKERKHEDYIASPSAPGWKYFKLYWHHSFDEWFASTQLLAPEDSMLWDEYYAPSIRDALSRSYYEQSICYMLNNNDVSFPAQKEDFRAALIKLYRPGNTAPECLTIGSPSSGI